MSEEGYDEEDQRHDRRRNWHLDKSVSLSNLLSTFALVGSVFAWVLHEDSIITNRLTAIEARSEENKSNQLRLEIQVDARLNKIDDALVRIEDKLDRKADKH